MGWYAYCTDKRRYRWRSYHSVPRRNPRAPITYGLRRALPEVVDIMCACPVPGMRRLPGPGYNPNHVGLHHIGIARLDQRGRPRPGHLRVAAGGS
jgi:hypothetical protein